MNKVKYIYLPIGALVIFICGYWLGTSYATYASPFPWDDFAGWLTAFGTIGAVIVALYLSEKTRRLEIQQREDEEKIARKQVCADLLNQFRINLSDQLVDGQKLRIPVISPELFKQTSQDHRFRIETYFPPNFFLMLQGINLCSDHIKTELNNCIHEDVNPHNSTPPTETLVTVSIKGHQIISSISASGEVLKQHIDEVRDVVTYLHTYMATHRINSP